MNDKNLTRIARRKLGLCPLCGEKRGQFYYCDECQNIRRLKDKARKGLTRIPAEIAITCQNT